MNCPRCGMPCWFAPKWNSYGCVDRFCAWTKTVDPPPDDEELKGAGLEFVWFDDEPEINRAFDVYIGGEWARTIAAERSGSLWANIAIIRRPGVPLRVDRDCPRNTIMGVSELWPSDPRD